MQSTGITEMEPGFTELMIQRDRQRQSKSACTQSNYELIDAGEVQDDNVCVRGVGEQLFHTEWSQLVWRGRRFS